jgi:hypothetical protein
MIAAAVRAAAQQHLQLCVPYVWKIFLALRMWMQRSAQLSATGLTSFRTTMCSGGSALRPNHRHLTGTVFNVHMLLMFCECTPVVRLDRAVFSQT